MTQMDQTDRLLTLLQRELRGCEISLHEHPPDLAEATLSRQLVDGRCLVVVAGPDSPSSATLAQKLDTLLECFGETLSSTPELESSNQRPPVEVALQRELEALVRRVHAADAFVIDVDSPVLWGSASAGHLPEVRPPRPRRPGPRRGALQLVVDQDTPTPSALPPAFGARPRRAPRSPRPRQPAPGRPEPIRLAARPPVASSLGALLISTCSSSPSTPPSTRSGPSASWPRCCLGSSACCSPCRPSTPTTAPQGLSNVIALNKKK